MSVTVSKINVMGTFDELYASLSPNAQRRGFEFEPVCKWFLQNDPTYSYRLKHVWLWKEWPDRWSDIDSGIDLVAEDTNGKLWAVQAKGYGEDNPIPKRELDKFFSASSRKQFSYRLLISTTTNGLHHIAQENTAAQEKPVLIVDLPDLRKSPVDWPKSLKDMRPAAAREAAQPREHQDEAILQVLGGFESCDRGQLIMACGTGKTLTAWFINEKISAQRTLVLVPSLSLLKQTMHEWEYAAGGQVRFASMPVCSDASVSNIEDLGLTYTAELGVPAETDPAEIAKFLRGRGPRVVFSTYHSSPQIAKAFERGRVPEFDLIVADEAHRVAGRASGDFATVLDGSRIRAKRRLFMTATPRVYSRATTKASKDENVEYASMDDHTKFGPVFHKLGFGEAIERKLLTNYRVAIIGVDNAMYHEWTQRGTFVTFDGKTPVTADKAAGQIGLAKAMREFDLRRTISFHSRRERAKKFAASMESVIKWMPAAERPSGKLWTGYASGEMDSGKRARLIRHLAGLEGADRGLLTNARCLAEGVDVPTLDGVAFIDPRRSEIDIVQAVGRAIRKSDDKHQGTIVVPVFIADGEDPETVLDSSAFKPVWDVLRALRSHDDELGRQLDVLRREMGREGHTPQLPPNIFTDLPKGIGEEFSAAFRIRLVESTTQSWEFWFGLLQRYVKEKGDSRIRRTDAYLGHHLGQWVGIQRRLYVTGTLESSRQDRLAVLPGWSWDVQADRWEDGFAALKGYTDEHGTTMVPARFKTDDGFSLGSWVEGQRGDYRKGILDAERTRRLETFHPTWSWNPQDEQWAEGYRRFCEYAANFGGAEISLKYVTPDGFRLGSWANKQRTRYALGTLDPERERRLFEIPGWVWNMLEAAWELGFASLVTYLEENGNAAVPITYRTRDGFRLGGWVREQRGCYAKGTLDPERRKRLEDLDGWVWNTRDDGWENGFTHLSQHLAETGTTAVPQGFKTADGYQLGNWVLNQRAFYRKGKLAPGRITRLEKLHSTWSWDPYVAAWENGFDHLKQFVVSEKHTSIPQPYRSPDGFKLGGWVAKQRADFRSGRLDQSRKERIEALHPTWTWDPLGDRREEGFAHLENFIVGEGHARVSRSYKTPCGFKLGKWVGNARTAHKKGTLDESVARRLEAIHPTWVWDAKGADMEEGFRHLMEYVAENDTARVPQTYKTPCGFALGVWLSTQRQLKRKGKLPADRQKRLQNSHPTWTWEPHGDRWSEGYAHLLSYIEREGDALVPRDFVTDDGYALGEWVKGRRTDYSRGGLAPDRRQLLEESHPTWAWSIRDDGWESGIQHLTEYSAAHGGALPVIRYVCPDGFRLGTWINKQRAAFANGKMPEDRRERLDIVRGWSWEPNEDKWVAGYEHLREFSREHGHARPERKYTSHDGYKLGSWLEAQRAAERRGDLSADRLERLNQFPNWL